MPRKNNTTTESKQTKEKFEMAKTEFTVLKSQIFIFFYIKILNLLSYNSN